MTSRSSGKTVFSRCTTEDHSRYDVLVRRGIPKHKPGHIALIRWLLSRIAIAMIEIVIHRIKNGFFQVVPS